MHFDINYSDGKLYDITICESSLCLYNFAGHGSLIGKETGKIIGVGTRITACRICDTAASCQKEPKKA